MGVLCASWIWMSVSFSKLGKFSAIISSNTFSTYLSFCSSGISITWMLLHLIKSLISLSLLLWYIIRLSLFHLVSLSSIILTSKSLIHSSDSSILGDITYIRFQISNIAFFIPDCFFLALFIVCFCGKVSLMSSMPFKPREHHHDCCLKFSIRDITCICFIRSLSCSFLCNEFLCLGILSSSLSSFVC